MATYSLALGQDNAPGGYGRNFNKNLTEVVDEKEVMVATCNYLPIGQVSSTGDPIHRGSEMTDGKFALAIVD